MNKRVRKLTKAALVIMSAIMLFACIGSLAKPKMASAGLIGDVNEDGIVNSKDLSMVQKIILGKYEVKETETPVETAEPSLEPVVTPSNCDQPPMQMMFDTLDEFFTWIENKEERYDKIYKYYESVEEDGGVWVPYYDGEPVQFKKIHECSTGLNGDTVKWGYGYDYSLEKFEEEGIEILPCVFLTDEEDKAEIQANYRDWFKGFKVEMSDEEFESKGYQEIIANVGGQNIPVIYKPDSETDSNERAFFLYEGECMYVLFYSSDTETNLEVLEKLSFEKVLFDEQVAVPEYNSLYFNSLEEFAEWKKDDKKYAPKASEALIKAIDRDGGILVPYFNDISVVEMKEDDVAIMLRFGNENEGKGYAYRFKSEDVHGLVRVYLLDEADEADAAENPLNYVLLGKENPLTDKQLENTPYKAKEFELFGEKYQGFYCPSSDDKQNGEEKLFFIYDGHFIVRIQLFKDSNINALEFAQKLSFKNIAIDK